MQRIYWGKWWWRIQKNKQEKSQAIMHIWHMKESGKGRGFNRKSLRWQGCSQKMWAWEMASSWFKVTCQRSPTSHRNGPAPLSCPTQPLAGNRPGEGWFWRICDGGSRGAAAETACHLCNPKANQFPKYITEEYFFFYPRVESVWFLWNDILTAWLW